MSSIELIREAGMAPYRRLWCDAGLHWREVVELPEPYLDEDTFVCLSCLLRLERERASQ